MYFYSEEGRQKAVETTAKEYRAAAGLFPAIRNVLEQFDGKMLNCRLEKALQEATGRRVYVKKEYNRVEVYYYGTTYTGSSYITLAQIPLDALPDGKRIPAALLVKSAREQRERHLKDAAALETTAENMEAIKQQIKYFIDQANKLSNGLPYELRDIYGIKYIYS